MAKLFSKMPFINLWNWANGEEYTIDEEIELTSDLKTSDVKTDKEYQELFGQKENRKNMKFKVKEEDLDKSKTPARKNLQGEKEKLQDEIEK